MDETKKVPFYKRREFWGTIVSGASVLAEVSNLGIFPQHTVVYKIGVTAGVILTVFGLRRGYKDKNLIGQENGAQLPSGLRKK